MTSRPTKEMMNWKLQVRMSIVAVLWIIQIQLQLTAGGYSEYSGNQCDWDGSGEHEDASLRLVHQVFLKCTRGHVQWRYPSSAIRINFEFLDKHTDFRLCIRPSGHSTGADIFRDIPFGNIVPIIQPSRPDLENMDKVSLDELKEIVKNFREQEKPREIHCFESRDGKVVMLLEAQRNPLSLPLITSFDYVLEPLSSNFMDLYHNYNDCRTCNATELIREFCASDFVIKARMLDIVPNISTSQNYLNVMVSHIYRQRDITFMPAKGSHYRGAVVRPLSCVTLKDQASYLITGGIVLGQAKAGCLVHFQNARRMFTEMTLAGLNECDLTEVIDYRRRKKEVNLMWEDHATL